MIAGIVALTELIIYIFDMCMDNLFLPNAEYMLRFLIIPVMINYSAVYIADMINKGRKSDDTKNYTVCFMCLVLCVCVELTHYVFAPVMCAPCVAIFITTYFADQKLTRRITICSLFSLIPAALLSMFELRAGDTRVIYDVVIAAVVIICINYIAKMGIIREQERLSEIVEGYQLRIENGNLEKNLELVEKARIEAEEARNAAERANNAKSNFLENISNKVRGPVNAIIGTDEMIIRDSDNPVVIDEAVTIQRSAHELLSAINNFLDLSRIESDKMKIIESEYDISEMIMDIENETRYGMRHKDMVLCVEVDEELPRHLIGDEVRVRQIITNITSNAVKFTEEGSIEINVGFSRINKYSIELIVKVSDTGIGIKSGDIPNLFDSYSKLDGEFIRNMQGTGLGLAIVKQLLDKMDGKIKVNSVYRVGSVFEIKIMQKIADDTPVGIIPKILASKKIGHSEEESFTAPNASILVVDDNLINLKVVEALLRRTKMQIDTVNSGAACIKAVSKKRYNVILLDHLMPEMDGIEVLKKIKTDTSSKCKDSPVIAMTANAVSGMRGVYLNKGFTDYLSKPVVGSRLESTIMKYLPEGLYKKLI